jgi:hypothetical protein
VYLTPEIVKLNCTVIRLSIISFVRSPICFVLRKSVPLKTVLHCYLLQCIGFFLRVTFLCCHNFFLGNLQFLQALPLFLNHYLLASLIHSNPSIFAVTLTTFLWEIFAVHLREPRSTSVLHDCPPLCSTGNISRSLASLFCIFRAPMHPERKLSDVRNVRGSVNAWRHKGIINNLIRRKINMLFNSVRDLVHDYLTNVSLANMEVCV